MEDRMPLKIKDKATEDAVSHCGSIEGPVDVVDCDGLKPYVRPTTTADAIYAF
jgi:hypothetical protein